MAATSRKPPTATTLHLSAPSVFVLCSENDLEVRPAPKTIELFNTGDHSVHFSLLRSKANPEFQFDVTPSEGDLPAKKKVTLRVEPRMPVPEQLEKLITHVLVRTLNADLSFAVELLPRGATPPRLAVGRGRGATAQDFSMVAPLAIGVAITWYVGREGLKGGYEHFLTFLVGLLTAYVCANMAMKV